MYLIYISINNDYSFEIMKKKSSSKGLYLSYVCLPEIWIDTDVTFKTLFLRHWPVYRYDFVYCLMFPSFDFLKLFWNEIFPLSHRLKNVWVSYGVIFWQNVRNFQELLYKVRRIEWCFSFFSKCVTVSVEKINDRWCQYRQQKKAEIGWWGQLWHCF